MRGSFSENEPYHTAIKETRARGRMEGGNSQAILLAREQRRGWSLMIFCAHATRGLRRPS
jgi:ABC-type uncharacterized transport system ATPase subunit